MAYFRTLDQPVSAEAPCGIDLDEDAEIQAFLTMAEGSLPASFRDFDRKEFDARGNIEKVAGFLERSRDVRLLVLAAKTFALTDDLDGFFECLDATAALLKRYWTDCHPRAQGGDYSLRTAYLQSFDDRPTIVLPLQYAPIIKDRKLGPVAYRAFLVARKPGLAKPGETVADEAILRDAFSRFEPLDELTDLRDKFKAARNNLETLRRLVIANVSHEAAPHFEHLPAYLQEVETYLSAIIAERSGHMVDSATPAPEHPPDPDQSAPAREVLTPIDIHSAREVGDALDAVAGYFAAVEPSSPAKLLVRQAQKLVGRSFVDAMIVLVPGLLERAKIDWAGQTPFSLSFAQCQDLASLDSPESELPGESRSFSVPSRTHAAELMRAVEAYYRRCEPSSPVPMLLDRARRLMGRDFSFLLAEFVPQDQVQE